MLQAEQALQQAAIGQYEVGVSGRGMTSDVREDSAQYFVQKLMQGLSRGEQLNQIQLKVLQVEGSQGHSRPVITEAFACDTAVKTLGKGAGGRYVFSTRPIQVAKKGPVRQQLTSTVLVSLLLQVYPAEDNMPCFGNSKQVTGTQCFLYFYQLCDNSGLSE